jgi:hypothetical protein
VKISGAQPSGRDGLRNDVRSESLWQEFLPAHVSVGVPTTEYLDKMLAEPFEAFTLSSIWVSVRQLREYGTAAKKLKASELKT